MEYRRAPPWPAAPTAQHRTAWLRDPFSSSDDDGMYVHGASRCLLRRTPPTIPQPSRLPSRVACPRQDYGSRRHSIIRSYLHYLLPWSLQGGICAGQRPLEGYSTSVLPSLLDSLWCSNGESLTVSGGFRTLDLLSGCVGKGDRTTPRQAP
jgi:hypothetical protein